MSFVPVPPPPSAPGSRPRLRLGVVKLASCDGCQLSLLALEDELLEIAARFEIVEFPEVTSSRSTGPFDILLVEGSVSTPEQAEAIVELRRQARYLVTIGACATAGGIQALRNWANQPEWHAAVYPQAEYVESLAKATPVREHVAVEHELPGCPINAQQLREVLVALAVGRRPQIRPEAVCLACKRRGTTCVMVARGIPCLGPVTQTGCDALCPTFGRGCYGCFGPVEQANTGGLTHWFAAEGLDRPAVGRLFAGFTGYAEPFRGVVTEHGGIRGAAGSKRTAPKPDATTGAAPKADAASKDAGGGS